jgi:hypothetical protein
MGRVEAGTVQQSVTTLFAKPEEPGEYAAAVLRVVARKDVGEPLTEQEREAARLALRLLGRSW